MTQKQNHQSNRKEWLNQKQGQGMRWVMSGQKRNVGEYVKQATQVLSQNQVGPQQSQFWQPGWYLSDNLLIGVLL